MSETAKDVAKQWYAAVHAGDFDGLFGLMAEDCVIEYYGPSVIPFAGVYRGKETCKAFFGHVANDVEIALFRQDEFIADGDLVAVTGRLEMKLKATGRDYASEYAHVLTIRDGKVARFRDFQDTAQALHVSLDIATPQR